VYQSFEIRASKKERERERERKKRERIFYNLEAKNKYLMSI